METDPAVVRQVTATSRPSGEDNYPPGSVIKLLGRPGRGHGVSTLMKCPTYSDTLKKNVFE